jgi:mono/diheme cytochrome c family protein
MPTNAARLLLILIVGLVLAGCTGLAGEPRIVATLPIPTATPEPRPPSAPPDIAAGAAIFAARCVSCHGANGAGRGELVLAGQVGVMSSFQDAATASVQRPTDWYSTITNGRIEKLMPPWNNALNEAERWAVAMYSYTMHYTPEQLALGAEVYRDFCAACHGESGRGDGPDAPTLREPPGDLTDPQAMLTLSDEHIYIAVAEGAGEMPAFADDLSEDEMRAAVVYTRTLSLANADAIGRIVEAASQPAVTPEVGAGVSEQAAETTAEAVRIGTVTGRISNGTAGGVVPPDLPVVIYRLDQQFNQTQYETRADASGAYRLEGVPLDPASNYVATVTYRERLFTSDVASGAGETLDLPVTIYELTEDPAVLSISGVVTQVNAVGTGLEVTQVMSFSNSSDRAFSTSQAASDGRAISIAVPLPVGSVVAGLINQGRYVILPDQYMVLDTVPVLPGDNHVVHFVYVIPYDAGGAVIEQPLAYNLNGQVRLLLSPDTLTASSEQLAPLGVETIGQRRFQSYGGTLTLTAGSSLRYTLSGAPAAAGAADSAVTANNLPLVILAVIGLQVVIFSGIYLLIDRRRQRAAPALANGRLIDALIRQIAELDADFEAGKIEKSVYERQRALLKDRLTVHIEKESAPK